MRPLGRISFFSCSLRQKSCQKIGFCHKLRDWRSRLGNPVSATALRASETNKQAEREKHSKTVRNLIH